MSYMLDLYKMQIDLLTMTIQTQAQNVIYICGESSPKFTMYRKQRLMVL